MKIKGFLLVLGTLGLIAAGTFFVTQIPVEALWTQEAVSEPQVELVPAPAEVSLVVDVETEAQPVEVVEEDDDDDVEMPTALVTVLEDEVFYFDIEDGEHVLIEEETKTIAEGDCIRTGMEGLAEIEFAPDVLLNLEPNSEVCVMVFAPNEAGQEGEQEQEGGEDGQNQNQNQNQNQGEDNKKPADVNLYINVSVGTVFFQKNDEDLNWDIKFSTPASLTYCEDDVYSFEVSTIFPGTENLSPENMETFINTNPALTPKAVCEDEDGNKFICSGCLTCSLLLDSNPMKTVVKDNTGEVKVTYLLPPTGFETAVLNASEMFIYEFEGYDDAELWALMCETICELMKGEEIDEDVIEELLEPFEEEPTPIPPVVTPVSPCGDGVCDIYGGENATNCPEDCQ